MPEMNGWWNPDSAYFDDTQSPATFVTAYDYVVDYFQRELGRKLIRDFEFNLNFRSFGYDRRGLGVRDFTAFTAVNPDNVTLVSFSGYNRCGITREATEVRDFVTLFGPALAAAREHFPGVPQALAEVSSSPYCDVDLVEWFEDVFANANASNLTRIGLFFNPDPDIGETRKPERWDAILTDYPNDLRSLVTKFTTVSAPSPQSVPSPVVMEDVRVVSPGREFVDVVPAPSVQAGNRLRLPWSVWSQFTHYLTETDNPALSPLTGEPFGSIGSVLRFSGRQSVLWSLQDGVSVGPSLTLGTIWSPNDDQWWNNYASVGGSVGVYLDAPRELADWGTFSVELFGEQRFYTTDTPARYDNGQEFIGGVRATMSFGGDWR